MRLHVWPLADLPTKLGAAWGVAMGKRASSDTRGIPSSKKPTRGPRSLLDIERSKLTAPQLNRISEAMDIIYSGPKKSTRGRKPDERLLSVWREWEMSLPNDKPSFWALAKKYYGEGHKYRESVKKGIKRLRRQLEESNQRGRKIAGLLSP
jgi:hypothetical protein